MTGDSKRIAMATAPADPLPIDTACRNFPPVLSVFEKKMETQTPQKHPSLALCLSISLAVNLLVISLVGLAWKPFSAPRIPVAPRLIRIALLPRPLPIPKPPARKIKPTPKRHIRPVIIRPKRVRTRPVLRRATTQAPSHKAHPHSTPHTSGQGQRAAPQIAAAPALTAPPQVPTLHPLLLRALAPPGLVTLATPVLAPSVSPGLESRSGSNPGQGSGQGAGNGNGGGGGPFGIGSGGTGNGEGLRHIAYVLDISGSMLSRIDRARDEIRTALNGLQPGETFDILTFSDDVHVFDNKLDPGTPDMLGRASYFLSTVQISGGTNLAKALHFALSLPDVNVVVLVTDGDPTQNEDGSGIEEDEDHYFQKLTTIVRAENINRARIYTIGLVGKDPDGKDRTFEGTRLLQQLSRDSGGVSKIVILGDAAPG